MPDTSIPGAIDALLTIARGCTFAKAPDGTAVLVSDGYPLAETLDVISVGGMPEPTVEGLQDYANLGASQMDEDYEIRCYVTSTRGVKDAGPLESAQKDARDAAFAIYKTFEAALRASVASLRLQGAPVLWSGIRQNRVQQTSVQNAGQGRTCLIDFTVRVRARI